MAYIKKNVQGGCGNSQFNYLKTERDYKNRPGVRPHMRLLTGKGGTKINKISTKSEKGRGKFAFSTSKPGLKILKYMYMGSDPAVGA
jgi:hypothetical protein